MEFLSDYGLFLAKAITIVVAIAVIASILVAVGSRRRDHHGHIEIQKLNDEFDSWEELLKSQALREADFKAEKKKLKKRKKAEKSAKDTPARKRLFVLDFDGDIRASAVERLRHEISAVLTIATADDEVLVTLESGGGMVHSYGLAASQLQRIRDHQVHLTVAVDRVAASGGYMMACLANTIISAPFALIGSIGVVGQLPNFHRLLKKHDIDFEMHTSGKYKRTLTLFGENSDEGRHKFQEELNDTHALFKEFVAEHRPTVDIDSTATGEIWFGRRALEHQLVDRLQTSNDFLMNKRAEADIFKVSYVGKKTLAEKVGLAVQSAVDASVGHWLERLSNSRFFQ